MTTRQKALLLYCTASGLVGTALGIAVSLSVPMNKRVAVWVVVEVTLVVCAAWEADCAVPRIEKLFKHLRR